MLILRRNNVSLRINFIFDIRYRFLPSIRKSIGHKSIVDKENGKWWTVRVSDVLWQHADGIMLQRFAEAYIFFYGCHWYITKAISENDSCYMTHSYLPTFTSHEYVELFVYAFMHMLTESVHITYCVYPNFTALLYLILEISKRAHFLFVAVCSAFTIKYYINLYFTF